MRARIAAIALTGVAALVSGTPSLAATAGGWTVRPGGAATAKSGPITLTDVVTGRKGTCASSTVSGTLKSGSGLAGRDIGSVTAGTFSSCTGPGKLAFTVKPVALPWTISFDSYDPSTGVVGGVVGHIEVSLTSSICSAVVNATSAAGGNGVVAASYTDGTGVLTFQAFANLHFWHVKGCHKLINNGDRAEFTGSYTVKPRQVITGP